MNNSDIIKIQNLILTWLSGQFSPASDAKVREVCQGAATTILGQTAPKYLLHTFFYPLVRAGYVECGINDRQKIVWQISKPMVLVQNSVNKRKWLGINLFQNQKDKILSKFDICERICSECMELHSSVLYWETPLDWIDKKLPVICNPPIENILKCFPVCSPKLFATKTTIDISQYRQIFQPGKGWNSRSESTLCNGFYRQSDHVFSPRAYFKNEEAFSVKETPDENTLARIMSYIDNEKSLGTYDEKRKTIEFFTDIPFIIARLLFLNSIFVNLSVNSKKYVNVDQKIFVELQRIFCGALTRS